MSSRWLLGITALCAAALGPAGPLSGRKPQQPVLRDRYFGESLFYARQGLYFEALERLAGGMSNRISNGGRYSRTS